MEKTSPSDFKVTTPENSLLSQQAVTSIQFKVETPDPYFKQKRNGSKKLGLSPPQKITAALRMIAYGVIGDFMDEYVWIGETTTTESLKKIVTTVDGIDEINYGRDYSLRRA